MTANGVGLDVSAIAGSGLAADGSANLDVDWGEVGDMATTGVATANSAGTSEEAAPIDHVHKGIFPVTTDKQLAGIATTNDGDKATNSTITSTPGGNGYVQVFLNQVKVNLKGDKTGDCYFSGDAGTNARAFGSIASGDTLHWNQSVAGFNIDTNDVFDWDYEA